MNPINKLRAFEIEIAFGKLAPSAARVEVRDDHPRGPGTVLVVLHGVSDEHFASVAKLAGDGLYIERA